MMTALPMPRPAAPARAARIDIIEEFGWRRVRAGSSTVWLCGHLHGDGEVRLLRLAAAGDIPGIARLLPELDGHFALAAAAPGAALAATDPVATIPLFFAATGDGTAYAIDARARRLAARGAPAPLDRDVARAIAMSGFAFGADTLQPGLRQLRAGEYALFRDGGVERARYRVYQPWRVHDRPVAVLQRELGEVLRAVFEKLARDLAGRPVLVPLSAGLDSRLVAAGLKIAGHRDVRCFAYGRPGNFEAAASARIAERLGFRWHFVPTTPETQRRFFAGAAARDFNAFADTLAAIPFHQDYDALQRLAASGFAPKDSVIVNGQSGDFISGNHVPKALWAPAADADDAARWRRILDAIVAKHYALWRHLQTRANIAFVHRRLEEELAASGAALGDPALDYALCEQSEHDHRQARYVVQGQRAYEHQGHEWRLPLWDRALVDFFAAAPLAAKRGQGLYRDTLAALDWGGVWRALPVNRKTIRPRWIVPVRFAAKLATAPRGRAAWHDTERRWFAWHMDTLANYAVVPYAVVRRDRRGFRNAFSWHAQAYLAEKGIALDDFAGAEPGP